VTIILPKESNFISFPAPEVIPLDKDVNCKIPSVLYFNTTILLS
jgi:hypothetical protein